jgi:hypothetical protein
LRLDPNKGKEETKMKKMKENENNERKQRRTCADCGCRMHNVSRRGRSNQIGLRHNGVNMHYILKNELWYEINKRNRGLLCLICAQIRLGRKFVPTDFKAVPLNFKRNGPLSLLFPTEFTDHMVEFVGLESQESLEKHYALARQEYLDRTVQADSDQYKNLSVVVKAETRKKTKREPSVAKKTKKAMADLKKNKKVFTGAVFGWNAKKGMLVPNWKEQNNIDWMINQIEAGSPAAQVARLLNANGLTGKKGGNWTSTSVNRTISQTLHAGRNDADAPKWFKDRAGKMLKV